MQRPLHFIRQVGHQMEVLDIGLKTRFRLKLPKSMKEVKESQSFRCKESRGQKLYQEESNEAHDCSLRQYGQLQFYVIALGSSDRPVEAFPTTALIIT